MSYTEAQARYRAKNIDKVRAKNRVAMRERRTDPVKAARLRDQRQVSYFKRAYGLSLDEVQAMYDTRGGRCDLCDIVKPAPHSRAGHGQSLVVDHCHDTAVVRGLLCYKCNTALGQLGDSPAALARVLQYVGGG